ncbi:hypothetical protein [Stappia sp. WLB 29]|uniref:hypothetical protein n=1 Tax=Stappia sp. WLB 29 TaxID=2925220 RepID=UPI0020C0F36D|nr:hypothetical protein [Stappia sp. WLB 29]
MDVGDVKEVAAWVDLMPGPGRTPTLHVTGTVTVPTPCHEVMAEFAGIETSEPPVYLVEVTLREGAGPCPQVLTDMKFHYIERSYAGAARTVRVFSGSDSEMAKIGEAH